MAFVPAVRKFYTSAVVCLPPKRAVPQIQKIRLSHDKSAPRWMPHIPIVYPFVPNDDFPRAASQLAPVLRNVKPFHVKLAKISHYGTKAGATVFAAPETSPATAISELQRVIETVTPEYNDLVLKTESGFAPHLTLGHYEKETISETVSRIQQQWTPIEFDVTELFLVSRNGDVPFEVRHSIQLGGTEPTKEYEENPQVFRPRDRRRDNSANRYKLFVSNLSWNVDSQALLDLFKEHRAKKGYVIMDKIRDRSRGYGFVEFETEADQQAALQAMQGREIDGRQVMVKVAMENRDGVAPAAGGAGVGAGAGAGAGAAPQQ